VARHRRRSTEWQLDLRPVLPTGPAVRNGTPPPPQPHPGQDDAAVLEALGQIQLAVEALRQTVDSLSSRLDGIEQRLVAQPVVEDEPRAARPSRQPRARSEAPDSAAASSERGLRRARRVPQPITQSEAAER
jgi:hypothetical protein